MGSSSNNRDDTAHAILLYDPATGEGKILSGLVRGVREELGVNILPKPIPSSAQVAEAAYQRTAQRLFINRDAASQDPHGNGGLAEYFKMQLEKDENVSTKLTDPNYLMDYLAKAMVAMSQLDTNLSPYEQHSSLLTGSPDDRTLLLSRATPLTPQEVTQFCKGLGSGKLGRVEICVDGSAIFDLPVKRANKLVQAVAASSADNEDWHLELPTSLPERT